MSGPRKVTYCSLDEIDEKYFPNLHKATVAEKREPSSSFGAALAKELLDKARQQLRN